MTTYVAFLRAINVAGHAKIKKDELKAAFTAAGCQNVETYIQSGNVIYCAPASGQPALAQKISNELRPLVGGEPVVIFRTLHHLETLVREDPFEEIDRNQDVKLYVALLASLPSPMPSLPIDDRKEALLVFARKGNDLFIVSGKKPNGFYGFPNNFVEKEFRVRATSRNWNTITKIVETFG